MNAAIGQEIKIGKYQYTILAIEDNSNRPLLLAEGYQAVVILSRKGGRYQYIASLLTNGKYSRPHLL